LPSLVYQLSSVRIGRNVVDNFETALRRVNKKNGTVVAFSFGKGANEEASRAKLHDKLEIKLVTVSELIKNNRQNGKSE
jgi:hypothetical protein